MAKARLQLKRGALERLMSDPKVLADLERRAAAIRDACNSQSSWGGYESEADDSGNRPRARVWSIGPTANADNARNQRLIRNLQTGG